jgi:hypothetical protein
MGSITTYIVVTHIGNGCDESRKGLCLSFGSNGLTGLGGPISAIAGDRSRLGVAYLGFRNLNDVPKSFGETVHCALRVIGGHVYRVVLGGGFFQHVCGNSEPMRAL